MELLRLKCPGCPAADMTYHATSTTKNHGGRVMDTGATCPVSCSETKKTCMEGWQTPGSVIWHVRKARTAGLGFHAAAHPFDKATNPMLSWERPWVDRHRVLLLSAVVHEFFASVIAGEEA